VEEMIALRQRFRDRQQWQIADELRDCLHRAKVILTDTAEGTLWQKLE
jgi:cysteinyl-tRNA synthetase